MECGLWLQKKSKIKIKMMEKYKWKDLILGDDDRRL